MNNICSWCGQEALYQFKNGKWCCSKSINSCLSKKEKGRLLRVGVKNTLPKYIDTNEACSFGCGEKARYIFKNGSYCCSDDWHRCSGQHDKLSRRSSKVWADPERREKLSKTQRKDLFAVAIPVLDDNKICYYCGERARYWFKTNDKYCCSDVIQQCSYMKTQISNRFKELWKTEEFRKKCLKVKNILQNE